MTHKYILLADDDAVVRTMVATVLHRLGHVVEAAANGRDALDIYNLKPGAFDILITDHSMPFMSGLELVEQLRSNGFDGKIIVMSGSLTGELDAAYRAKRVNKILEKPFTMADFESSLEGVFNFWK